MLNIDLVYEKIVYDIFPSVVPFRSPWHAAIAFIAPKACLRDATPLSCWDGGILLVATGCMEHRVNMCAFLRRRGACID